MEPRPRAFLRPLLVFCSFPSLMTSRLRLRLGDNAQDHHIDRCSMFDLCRPLLIGTSSGKKKQQKKKLVTSLFNLMKIKEMKHSNSIFILSYWKWLFTKRPSMLHLQVKSDFTARYDIRNWKKTKRQTIKKYKCIKTPCINNWYAKRIT